MVFFLHGLGSNERDLLELKKVFSPDDLFISIQAPHSIGPDNYQWFKMKGPVPVPEEVEEDVTKVNELILEMQRKYRLSQKRVILLGFSQGAMISIGVGLKNPHAVGRVVALSGKILPSFQQQKKFSDFKSLKIFLAHGEDDVRVPFEEATKAQKFLTDLGVKLSFHAYKKLGHSIGEEELKDLKEWLKN
jgi:phospholipase/carboxylesterase